MGVTSYYSFGGELLGEETSGVRRDYLTDALGSVTATVTEAGTVENTYRYKPYGETLAKTGVGSDPKFLWNGKWGYLSSQNGIYVRYRYYSQKIGRWFSKDLIKIDGHNYYSYVHGNVVNLLDFLGLRAQHSCCCCADSLSVKIKKGQETSFSMEYLIEITAKFNHHIIKNKNEETPGDCSLEWWEKATYTSGNEIIQLPNEWNEQFSLIHQQHLSSPTEQGWLNRKGDCPGRGSAIMHDAPALPIYRGTKKEITEIRCFDIVLKSTPTCKCNKSEVHLKLIQKVTTTKDGKFSPKDSGMSEIKGDSDKYCNRGY